MGSNTKKVESLLHPSEKGTWITSFPVRSFEAGSSGKAKPLSIVHYFQEIAGIHATQLGLSLDQLFEMNLTWMLARLHYRFLDLPQMGTVLHVKTWPSGTQGIYATREFQAFGEREHLVAEGTSAWLMFDLKRQRPIRLPDFINTIQIPSLERPIPDSFSKMHPLTSGYAGKTTFLANYEDLDINNHVNNAVYVDWVLRSTPLTIKQQATLESIALSFKAEVRAGQEVEVHTATIEVPNGYEMHHRVVTSDHHKEVALAKAIWTPIPV